MKADRVFFDTSPMPPWVRVSRRPTTYLRGDTLRPEEPDGDSKGRNRVHHPSRVDTCTNMCAIGRDHHHYGYPSQARALDALGRDACLGRRKDRETLFVA